MNQDILNKGIQDIQKIALNEGEKKMILNQVMQIPIASPYAPTPTLWSFFRMRTVYVGALLTIFVLTSGTLAYASENTLPGDLLYPVKINVTEPLRDVLAIGATSRAKWEATKAMRRLTEAENLAAKNQLTRGYQKELKKHFNAHVHAFEEKIKSVATSTKDKDELDAFFDESIEKHSTILREISSDEDNDAQEEVHILESALSRNNSRKEIREREGESTSSDTRHPEVREIKKD